MQMGLTLKILLPYKIFAELKNISSITAETNEGSFGILPHRLDCVAIMVPGILKYETSEGSIHYVAVDEGILIKTETDVVISVRNALTGQNLGDLQESVEKEFKNLDENEKEIRSVLVKLESGFMRTFEKFRKE